MSKYPGLSKSSQAGRYSKKTKIKKHTIHIKESANQKFVNDYLLLKKIQNIRVSDSVWKTLHFKNPKIKMLLAKGDNGANDENHNGLKDVADNTCFIKISDKYSLALHGESKSTNGVLSGGQKKKARVLPYQIWRNPENVIDSIEDFIKTAELLKSFLAKK